MNKQRPHIFSASGFEAVSSFPGGHYPSAGSFNCQSGIKTPSSLNSRASVTVAARTALLGIGSVRKSLNLKRSIFKPADIRDALSPVGEIYTRRPLLRQDAAKSIAAHLDIQTIQACCRAIHGGVVELSEYIDREVMPCL